MVLRFLLEASCGVARVAFATLTAWRYIIILCRAELDT